MRNLCEPAIAKWRDHEADRMYQTPDDERAFGGAFLVPHLSGPGLSASRPTLLKRAWLRVIASNDDGWDHVSVSLRDRTPTWDEMEYIKHLFFRPDETAMQLHVPGSDHVNNHPYCLHLWRPHGVAIPRPPADMVGVPGLVVAALP